MAEFDPIPLKFTPGVVKDRTRRSNELGWWDTDMVRFVEGHPQMLGGWQKPFEDVLVGPARSLYSWFDFDAIQLMGAGTYAKYYIESGGSLEDITPIRASATLGSNPIATTNLSSIITVTHASHGANAGDFVTLSGATTTNGVADTAINGEHEILTATINTYTVDTGDAASSTGSGGGASVDAEYQLGIGLDTTLVGSGYGAGTWGRGTWDSAAVLTVQGAQLRVWSQDNWGEDLLINPRGFGIYVYDRSSPSRAVEIGTLPGANETPLTCDQLLIASEEQHVLAFGCNNVGSSTHDPLLWRWSDQEDYLEWEPTASTAAGGHRFLIGSKFYAAVKTRQEIMAFTDRALYSIQYVGNPDYFVSRLISPNVKLVGPKAAGFLGDAVFWMETRGFGVYDGQVRELPCPVKEYVFRDINLYQLWKCHCAVNSLYNEVWFFYCSADSEEINRYVMVKVPEMWWANGTLPRTAMLNNDVYTLPRGAGVDGSIYDHEVGYNDGASDPIIAHAESSPLLIGNGARAMRIRSIWPDVDFLDSTSGAPTVEMVLKLQDKPGSAIHGETESGVTRTVVTPIQVFTDKVDIGRRARMMAFRIQSEQLDLQWRLGTPHIELRPDGRA